MFRVFGMLVAGLILAGCAPTDTRIERAEEAAAVPEEQVGPLDKALSWVQIATEAGHLSAAEAVLHEQLAVPGRENNEDVLVALEVIRRIRLDYSRDAAQMLERLRRDIPDVQQADLEQWTREGVLQHRVLDGTVAYFKSEPANLYRFSLPAKQRRDAHRPANVPPADAAAGPFVIEDYLAKLVAVAESGSATEICPLKHRVKYTLTVKDNHPLVKKGAKVRCWLPYPQEYRQQKGVRLLATDPPVRHVTANGHPQRTLYFEEVITDPSRPPAFQAEFGFTTWAYYPRLDPAAVKPYDENGALFKEYTAERAPHIVFTPALRGVVGTVVSAETNPLEKARRIFSWVDSNVRYCSEVEYSTIPNISNKALTTRRGDCGVQGLLFITMCRCAGVPARWQSGWETLPNDWNMHDWAEFYVEPWGWLPADPSYGLKQHADPRVREFFFGHMDAYRMIVNLDYARPLDPPKLSFRSEPNDFQRGEIEIDGKNLYFDEWDWHFEFETTAEPCAPATPDAAPQP